VRHILIRVTGEDPHEPACRGHGPAGNRLADVEDLRFARRNVRPARHRGRRIGDSRRRVQATFSRARRAAVATALGADSSRPKSRATTGAWPLSGHQHHGNQRSERAGRDFRKFRQRQPRLTGPRRPAVTPRSAGPSSCRILSYRAVVKFPLGSGPAAWPRNRACGPGISIPTIGPPA